MKILKIVYIKLYYRFLYLVLPKKILKLPDSLKSSRNIFLYFDYEREYSGHYTVIKDADILNLLDLLNQFSFKSTWFTVGQIFNKYPVTIEAILKKGHEMASHTYNHNPPLHTTAFELKKDFEQVETNAPIKMQGFHSPNGRWSISTLKYLKEFGYMYDVVTVPKASSFLPFIHLIPGGGRTIRLHTLGDDWELYQKDNTEEKVCNHFKRLYQKLSVGEIAGIGFHPWVLFSDQKILKGFLMFLKFLQEQADIQINTAIGYASKLKQ